MYEGCDFTYRYYETMLQAAKAHFDVVALSQAYDFLGYQARPKLTLRHDVDVSLRRALRMARLDHELGVFSTFMIMPDSPLYSIDEPRSRQILRDILEMGHGIGLHYNPDETERDSRDTLQLIEPAIFSALERVQQAIAAPVDTVSFHRPTPRFLRGPFRVANCVNAHSVDLMAWYISDSRGTWRDGDPLLTLKQPKNSLLQLLVHPIWWDVEESPPENRLQEFFEAETHGKPCAFVERFDSGLRGTLRAVSRRGTMTDLRGDQPSQPLRSCRQ